ncbi:MAG: hypothetical protein ABFC38_14665 [Methanospirillum sp.]
MGEDPGLLPLADEGVRLDAEIQGQAVAAEKLVRGVVRHAAEGVVDGPDHPVRFDADADGGGTENVWKVCSRSRTACSASLLLAISRSSSARDAVTVFRSVAIRLNERARSPISEGE